MSLILESPYSDIRGGAIEILAHHLKLPLQFKRVEYTRNQCSDETKRNPFKKFPILHTPEGDIHESNTILRYLARKHNSPLYGKSAFEMAKVDQWLDYLNHELDAVAYVLFDKIFGWESISKEAYKCAREELIKVVERFNEELKNKNYLTGSEITIADIGIAAVFHPLFRLILAPETRQKVPNLVAWYQRIHDWPSFKDHFGNLFWCQKEFYPHFQEHKEHHKKEEHKKKEEHHKKQEPKKKEEPKKKQEPKKKEEPKKKKKEEQEEEEEEVPEVKKKNPLDMLPKSDFVLDDFKREISNAPDKKQVLRNFWKKYDPNGWSLWKVKYQRYEGEGVVGYLTANLKNGFIRNLDHFRKYAFAAVGVYGTEGNYEIQGVWLWRGTQIPAEWKEHQSFEYHTFQRLDHTKEADRALVEEYWLNTEEGQMVEGMPVFEAKHFK